MVSALDYGADTWVLKTAPHKTGGRRNEYGRRHENGCAELRSLTS